MPVKIGPGDRHAASTSFHKSAGQQELGVDRLVTLVRVGEDLGVILPVSRTDAGIFFFQVQGIGQGTGSEYVDCLLGKSIRLGGKTAAVQVSLDHVQAGEQLAAIVETADQHLGQYHVGLTWPGWLEGGMGLSQETGTRQVVWEVLHVHGEVERGRDSRNNGSPDPRECRTEFRPSSVRLVGERVSGSTLERRVPAVRTDQGADVDQLVHHPGQPGHVLADLDSRHGRRDHRPDLEHAHLSLNRVTQGSMDHAHQGQLLEEQIVHGKPHASSERNQSIVPDLATLPRRRAGPPPRLPQSADTHDGTCGLAAELSNHDYRRWRQDLAAAVHTEAERVAVHCVHPHDTPWPDRDAQDLLDAHGCPDLIMAGNWCEQARAACSFASQRGF